jgi:hypothetical protein
LVWKSGEIWQGARLVPPAIELPATQQSDAADLAYQGSLFILAHEYGHVILHTGSAESILSPKDELDADEMAMTTLFQRGQRDHRIRMPYMGATLALRVFSGLERLGHKFPGTHPPPAQRLQVVHNTVRKLCRTEGEYWSISPIS